MPIEIRPLTPADLPALSRFLTTGFGTTPDAEFASLDILNWKYFDSNGLGGDLPRSLVAVDEGAIVGHIGLYLPAFERSDDPSLHVPTMHMLDWLAAPTHRGVGARLMRRANALTPMQYGIGGSEDAKRVGLRSGYERIAPVPIYRRVLRHGYPFRRHGASKVSAFVEAGKNLARTVRWRPHSQAAPLEWRPVERFGTEVEPLLNRSERSMIFTSRPTELLNHLLRHPRGRIWGGLVLMDDEPCGFGLLSLVDRPEGRVGQIIECWVEGAEAARLSATIALLTDALRQRQADLVTSFGSTPWMADALRANGYYSLSHVYFYLRDKDHFIPRELPFHVMPIEVDYAYT